MSLSLTRCKAFYSKKFEVLIYEKVRVAHSPKTKQSSEAIIKTDSDYKQNVESNRELKITMMNSMSILMENRKHTRFNKK